MGETRGWSSSQRNATWPAVLPCASPISASVASSGHAAVGERRVGGDQHVVLARELQQPVLAQERVVLDLVAEHRRVLERLRQQPGREVRHAQVADPAGLAQLVERDERPLERHGVVGPVQQQQVEVVGAQPSAATPRRPP